MPFGDEAGRTFDHSGIPPGLAFYPGYSATAYGFPSRQSQFQLASIVPAPPKERVFGPAPDETRDTIKTLAVESGSSREGVSQGPPQLPKENTLHDEDFPALGAPKTVMGRSGSPAVTKMPAPRTTIVTKKQADKTAEVSRERTDEGQRADGLASGKDGERKPLIINTELAKATRPKPVEASAASEKLQPELSASFPLLSTPSATGASSPVLRTAPKTLRVVATPKAETPPASSPAATTTAFAQSVVSRAVSATQRPDTPVSEMISDTASIASASVSASRSGSPPPGKVGAAAVRSTTKSQQRKQRKEALKQDTKIVAEASKPEREEHAPVIGRKKKQKKEKTAKSSSPQQTSTDTEPPQRQRSTSENILKETVPDVELDSETDDVAAKAKDVDPKKSIRGKNRERQGSLKENAAFSTTTALVETTPDESSDQPEKTQPGPQSVFGEIKSSLWMSVIDKLQMLKPVTNNSPRAEHPQANTGGNKFAPCKGYPCKCGEIQEGDLAALRAGKPVRKQFHLDGSRMLITPNGDCVRGLSPEEEDTFLQLQAAISTTADHPGAFVAPRHQPGNGAFSLIKGRAVPNGRPNIFPATSQPQSQDPIGKLQREDALSYINQYVLPRLNLGGTNTGFAKGASPTRDAAAASLNSLAPYFYGPDAAAGVGIYSSPDGARAIHEFGAPGSQGVDDGGKSASESGINVGGMPLMSVEDAETSLIAARKETEKLEKGLNAVIKRNRRLVLGGSN